MSEKLFPTEHTVTVGKLKELLGQYPEDLDEKGSLPEDEGGVKVICVLWPVN